MKPIRTPQTDTVYRIATHIIFAMMLVSLIGSKYPDKSGSVGRLANRLHFFFFDSSQKSTSKKATHPHYTVFESDSLRDPMTPPLPPPK